MATTPNVDITSCMLAGKSQVLQDTQPNGCIILSSQNSKLQRNDVSAARKIKVRPVRKSILHTFRKRSPVTSRIFMEACYAIMSAKIIIIQNQLRNVSRCVPKCGEF